VRDEHRLKDKVDLTLDSRQLVSLLVGGIIVLGAVFVLGVVVGKKLAQNPHSADAPNLLSALDEKTEALEKVRQTPPLTFQDELTKKAEPAVASAPKPPPPAVASAPKPPPPAAAPPAPAPAHAAVVIPVEPAKTPTPVAMRPTPPASEPTPKVAPAKPQTVPNGPFTLQLGASQDKDDANRQIARLKDKGYAPYLVTAQVPGKGTWYRVRMGSFPSKDAAQHYLQDFHRETQLDAFVASTH
jgi:cell division septation protein DedD